VVHPGSEAPGRNAFTAKLTGAREVRFDLQRMRLSLRRPLTADVTTDHELAMQLVSGKRVRTVDVPAGHHTLTL
jgi:hypothetical protein